MKHGAGYYIKKYLKNNAVALIFELLIVILLGLICTILVDATPIWFAPLVAVMAYLIAEIRFMMAYVARNVRESREAAPTWEEPENENVGEVRTAQAPVAEKTEDTETVEKSKTVETPREADDEELVFIFSTPQTSSEPREAEPLDGVWDDESVNQPEKTEEPEEIGEIEEPEESEEPEVAAESGATEEDTSEDVGFFDVAFDETASDDREGDTENEEPEDEIPEEEPEYDEPEEEPEEALPEDDEEVEDLLSLLRENDAPAASEPDADEDGKIIADIFGGDTIGG